MSTTSNTRAKVFYVLDIILRVPPLFMIDSVLHKGYPYEYAQPLYNSPFGPKLSFEDDFNDQFNKKYLRISSLSVDLSTVMIFCINLLGLISATVMFMLSSEHLLMTYKWLFAMSTLFLAYFNNVYYMDSQPTSIYEQTTTLFLHVLIHLILAITFSLAHRQFENEIIFILLTFLIPSIMSFTPLYQDVSSLDLPRKSMLMCFLYVTCCCVQKVPRIIQELNIKISLTRMYIRYYGFHALLENEWMRLSVPHVLRVFWTCRVVHDAIAIFYEKTSTPKLIDLTFINSIWSILKEILIRGCDTVLAILGMTSVVASLSYYIGYAIQQFLLTDDDEEKSIGTVSAVLFFVLALQTGLTGLEPEKRFIRLYRNFCLLFTAILHFVHNIVNPLLMSLSASRNRSIHRHGRVLTICLFLITFPCWFLSYLWNQHSISTWMLAVSAFTVEVIIKVVISLLLYFLFMIDAYRNTFWEKLDDYIYYIRATGNTIEFIFGIFLFFNGAWILLFESGGAIRACMMCIHAYINIWLQAKAGWRTFIKRRTAVNKINALPEATEEQLQRFDDVCAICYQELTNARITKCNHYFHGVCLRKWLYVQDRCPLCHNTLYKLDSDVEDFSPDMQQRNSEENNTEEVDDVDTEDGGENSTVRLEENHEHQD